MRHTHTFIHHVPRVLQHRSENVFFTKTTSPNTRHHRTSTAPLSAGTRVFFTMSSQATPLALRVSVTAFFVGQTFGAFFSTASRTARRNDSSRTTLARRSLNSGFLTSCCMESCMDVVTACAISLLSCAASFCCCCCCLGLLRGAACELEPATKT